MSLNKFTTNTVRDANIDDSDEYLNIKETTNQVKINNILNCKDRAKRIPKYVAIPLPPLNFNQMEKIWPKKAARADRAANLGKYINVNITGI